MARMSLVLVLAFLGPGVAQAARIETGAACSLVDAITSANTNAAVGGCIAGDPGRDTVVVAAATLSAADNGSNALPVVVEDLTITSADPDGLGSIRRDATVGTTVQLERVGYFCKDRDSKDGAPVWNRTIGLKDSWAKEKGA